MIFEQYTKDAFLEEYVKSNCPSDVGLEDFNYETCTGTNTLECQECWNEAVKNINFKSDIMAFEEQAINVLNNLAATEAEYKKISDSRDKLKKSLLEMMEEFGLKKFENEMMSISYVAESKTKTFDSKAFKNDYPEVYKDYVKESNRAANIRFKLK